LGLKFIFAHRIILNEHHDETLPLMNNAVADQDVWRMKYGDFEGKKFIIDYLWIKS
jgi:hypothetical protein